MELNHILMITTSTLIILVISVSYFLFVSKKALRKYSPIIYVEAEAKRIKKEALDEKSKILTEAKNLKSKINKMKESFEALSSKHQELKTSTCILEEELSFMDIGMYKSIYDFGSSEKYKEELQKIKDRQKRLIKEKRAIICTTSWTVNGSKREGTKQTNRLIKLALNAYNVECDNLILKVKYNNIDSIKERLDKLFSKIESYIETNACHINKEFHELKKDELVLVHEYNEKLQEEKEEQQAIREQMREEEKVLKEIENAKKKAEKEEQTYQKALEKAKKDLEKAKDSDKEVMLSKIKELEKSLEEALSSKERAISMAQQTKRGHVYVISNIGAFGEEVFKIGMTRRLKPEDRIRELSSASVPFPYDVHAMIFSENAPELENKLHKNFTHKRVNKVNTRKEFFKIELSAIEEYCLENNLEIEFTKTAEAKDFRQTTAMEREKVEAKNKSEANEKAYDISDIDLEFNLDEEVA